MATSWEIIKQYFVKLQKARVGSFGYQIALNEAIDLFMSLHDNLTDKEESLKAFNADDEVGQALLLKKDIQDFKDAGII